MKGKYTTLALDGPLSTERPQRRAYVFFGEETVKRLTRPWQGFPREREKGRALTLANLTRNADEEGARQGKRAPGKPSIGCEPPLSVTPHLSPLATPDDTADADNVNQTLNTNQNEIWTMLHRQWRRGDVLREFCMLARTTLYMRYLVNHIS